MKKQNGDFEIDLNFTLKDLEGKEIKDSNAGKIVGGAIAQLSKGDPLKYWSWAQKLYKGEKLVLDASDKEALRKIVSESESFTTLLKGQVLPVFNE